LLPLLVDGDRHPFIGLTRAATRASPAGHGGLTSLLMRLGVLYLNGGHNRPKHVAVGRGRLLSVNQDSRPQHTRVHVWRSTDAGRQPCRGKVPHDRSTQVVELPTAVSGRYPGADEGRVRKRSPRTASARDDGPSDRALPMVSAAPAIAVTNISKSFGGIAALKDVSFTVSAGEVVRSRVRTGPGSRRSRTLSEATRGQIPAGSDSRVSLRRPASVELEDRV
jgi:hypothetical protein